MKLFITGATGFVGSQIVEELCAHAEVIYLLVRPKSVDSVKEKYANYKNIVLILGDVSSSDVIFQAKDLQLIINECDTIIHAAALYQIDSDVVSCYRSNVMGTQNVLFLAQQIKNLKKFIYTSTIAVAGNFSGEFKNEMLDAGQTFSDNYSSSKFQAERLLQNWNLVNVEKIIYRLGVVVGNSTSGKIDKIDGPYYFFKWLNQYLNKMGHLLKLPFQINIPLPFPFLETAKLPIIPVDYLAKIIKHEILKEVETPALLQVKTLVDPQAPLMGDLLVDYFKVWGIDIKPIALPKNPLNAPLMNKLNIPSELLNFLYGETFYPTEQMEEIYLDLGLANYSIYKLNLLKWAKGV